jgi:hypothetical protein
MKHKRERRRKIPALVMGVFFLAAVMWPAGLWAETEVDALKQQLNQLTEMMEKVEQKLADLEAKNDEKDEEMEEVSERLDEAELHTATDKLSLGVELRSRGDSIHFQDMQTAPSSFMASFFTPVGSGGFNGATKAQIQTALANMKAAGLVPASEKHDIDNDIIFTNRFRMNMKAKINPQLSFGGRLSAYKVWGDSTGVRNYQGSAGDVTLDGTTASIPTDDAIHLERAYFNYKTVSTAIPVNFSLGRRPSTNGPPLEYGDYNLEGGSPLAHVINWQFDGASLSFGLEGLTGVPGAAFKLCYGVGYESDWGNSTSLKNNAQLDDVNLFGFIASLYDNDNTSAELNFAHAWDITDGFAGTTVMPFTTTLNSNGTYTFTQNTGSYISRTEPSTNLGDWDAATLLFRTNLSERMNADIDLFLSFAWSHTDPEKISDHPFYNLMGEGLLSSDGKLESQDGYSIYAGIIFPMPLDARLGLEYNWGSQYWFNFTGAEDSLVDSKLAARGHVFEGYYIQPVFGDTFFLKLGGRYYDYEYTGSGNPLGAPVKVSEANALNTLFPVADKVWNAYLSATVRF